MSGDPGPPRRPPNATPLEDEIHNARRLIYEERRRIAVERNRILQNNLQQQQQRTRDAREQSQAAEDRYRSASQIVRSILDDRPPDAQVSPSGELLRVIERFHQGNSGRTQDGIHAATPSRTTMSSDPTRDLQRRFSREPQDRNIDAAPPYSGLASGSTPSLPPLRSLGSRRAPTMSGQGGSGGRPSRYRPSERYFDRYRTSTDHRSTNPSFEDLDHTLEDANSHLRALLDFTTNNPIISPLTPSLVSPPLQPQEHAEDSRRVKRRKLDSDRLGAYKGFRYGRYGQVEPGQLTMEIVSCDGGLYSNESCYAAENILKNDNSVYCTKGNRCNVVLRHQGATVFSLKELIIKAPGSNYSSPVREGMVFISMNSDDLLSRTAQYQIQYQPSRGGRSNSERENRALASIMSIHHHDDGSMTRAQMRQRRLYVTGMDDDEDFRTAQIPSEFTINPPPFRVTTTSDCSDDEDENEPRARRRTPNRIGVLPFESDSSEDGNPFAPYDYASFEDNVPMSYPRGENMTLAEAAEASQLATQEAVRAVGGELMAPHAKFNIEKDKNKCTIKFDPPVSGRFILLKMWSPHHDPTGNIDIQGVVAKGFAGPRYFPSVELR